MALWEYKVITSGKGGFASATMLESYLNQLGKDEWEIIDFRTDPSNGLAFNGLARRPTQREWTLEAAVAAAAKAEADKLRAELMHKQHAGDAAASSDAGSTPAASPEGLRQLRDTDRDHDPEALADEVSHGTADDWNNLDQFEDDLPTFFDAIKPHLRKNPSTPGQSVALNYLAKRWEQPETDLYGALKECGFAIPENPTEPPVFLEFEGDLYWVEKNDRAQFFLNTREKPQPKFRIVPGKPLDPSDPVYAALAAEQAEIEAERARKLAEQAAREAEAQARRAEREAQRLAAEQARREQQAAAQAAAQAAREAREAARTAAFAAAAAAASVTPLLGATQVTEDNKSPAGADQPDAGAGTGTTPPASDTTAPLATPSPLEPPASGASSAEAAPLLVGVLPAGPALLDMIRPQMRRNRRGPGYSGSSAYLAKFFKVEDSTLRAALAEVGLVAPEGANSRVETKVIGAYAYWVNKDSHGGLWINGREASARERTEASSTGIATPPPTRATDDTELPKDAAGDSVPFAAAAAVDEAPTNTGPATTATAEPPIFRAVPRAMPPIPVAVFDATAGAEAPPAEAAPLGPVTGADVESAVAAPEPSIAINEPAAAVVAPGELLPVATAEPVSDEHTGTAPVGQADRAPLAALRVLLKPNRSRSGLSGSLVSLAGALGRSEAEVTATLIAQGLVVPHEPRQGEDEAKPVFVEHVGEIYWLNRFVKDGTLWLNVKPTRASAARKAKGKDAAEGEAEPAIPAVEAEADVDKTEKVSARPRTKRRSAAAIEADSASEE